MYGCNDCQLLWRQVCEGSSRISDDARCWRRCWRGAWPWAKASQDSVRGALQELVVRVSTLHGSSQPGQAQVAIRAHVFVQIADVLVHRRQAVQCPGIVKQCAQMLHNSAATIEKGHARERQCVNAIVVARGQPVASRGL